MIGPILRRAEAGRQPGFREVTLLLQARGADYQALLETAQRIAQAQKGGPTPLGLVRLESGLARDKTLLLAQKAWREGCKILVLQHYGDVDPEEIAALVRSIKSAMPVKLALALGERSYDEYALWKSAGADQYLLPHETSDAQVYAQLHPGKSPAGCLTRYLWLRGLRYQVGGGLYAVSARDVSGLVGDLEILMNLAMESVVIRQGVDADDLYRLVAVTRLCLPRADIWVQTPIPDVETRALRLGASALLRPLTPLYREEVLLSATGD